MGRRPAVAAVPGANAGWHRFSNLCERSELEAVWLATSAGRGVAQFLDLGERSEIEATFPNGTVNSTRPHGIREASQILRISAH